MASTDTYGGTNQASNELAQIWLNNLPSTSSMYPMPVSFHSLTRTAKIHSWLKCLKLLNSNIYIHPSEVAFTTERARATAIKRANSKDVQCYKICDTLQTVIAELDGDEGTVMYFSNPVVSEGQLNRVENTWHAYAVIFRKGMLYIFDPDYSPPSFRSHLLAASRIVKAAMAKNAKRKTSISRKEKRVDPVESVSSCTLRRLSDFCGLTLVKKFVPLLILNGHRVEEIRIGGGNHVDEGECVRETAEFIEKFVQGIVTWPDMNNWERILPYC